VAELLQFLITGIAVGMVYALIALGFALIWKSSSVANLALGQIVLVSSWFTYAMLVQAQFPLWLAFPLVILFALALGWIIERFALRPLIAQPILALITVTLGIGYFIEGVVTFIWPWSVDALPRLFPREVIHIGPAVVSQEYVWVVGICLLVFALLTLFFRYHKMGIAMRATADDQMAVQACGIPGWYLNLQHRWYYPRSGADRTEGLLCGDTGRTGFLHWGDYRRTDNRTL